MNASKFRKISTAFFLALAVAAALFPPFRNVSADTTAVLRPTADGGEDSASWKNTAGTTCNSTDCYTQVNESSGSTCTNSDGDTSYITNSTNNVTQTFDIDESSIPDSATITSIAVTVCYARAAGGPLFQTRVCADGSCTNSGVNLTGTASYQESAQSQSVNVIKTASTDLEIGVSRAGGAGGDRVKISQISAVITYTPAGDTTPPSAVTNLAASNATASSIDLTWTAPGDDGNTGTATSYDVRYSTASINEGNWSSATQATGEPTPQVAGSSESFTVSGLSAGTTYYFALKTSDEVPNTSAISNVPSAATTAPSAISGSASADTHWVKGGASGKNFVFTVNNSATSTQSLQWVKIERPSSRYTLTAGSASGWSSSVSGGTSATFTGGTVTAGGSGTFTVTADISSGDETQIAWAVSISADSGGASPVSAAASSAGALDTGVDSTAPTNVGVSSVTVNSSVKLTANAMTSVDSASGLASSTYWFDETSGGPGANDSTDWQAETAFADDGLTAATQYCYRVKARDFVGNESSYSSTVCGTTSAASSSDSTAPSATSNLSIQSTAGTSITLAWTAPGDDGGAGTAASYDVRYSTSDITSVNWSSATQATSEPTPSIAGSSESFTVSGLASSTTYYFAVKTSDEVPNESTISNVVSGATTSGADSTPPVISGVALSGTTQNSAVIAWTTNEAADSQVEFGISQAYGSQTTLDSNKTTSHVVTLYGLTAGTVYNYRVKSTDAAGNPATSDNMIFSTITAAGGIAMTTAAPRITDISVSTTTESSATIIWKTDQQATSRVDYARSDSRSTQIGDENTTLTYDHKVVLVGLEPETQYRYQAISKNSDKREVASGYFEFATRKPKPKPPPIISDVKVVSVRPNTAKISWKTDVPATSQISFGTETGKLNQVTIELSTLVTDHSASVSDLSPKTAYFFKAVSRSAEAVAGESEEKTFTTESLEIQTVVEVKKAEALAPGSPGTQVPKVAVGETVTFVPIASTPNDKTPPEVALFKFAENPTKNTSPVIQGTAKDKEGVIAGISYSTDGGGSWHPIGDVSGIGSTAARFSVKMSNLREGTYPILFRVRDNSGNIGKSEVRTLIIAIDPPVTGANVLLLGTQSFFPSALGTITTLAGISQRLVTSAVGGVTNVEILARRTDIAYGARGSGKEQSSLDVASLVADAEPRTVSLGGTGAWVALAAESGKEQKVSTSSKSKTGATLNVGTSSLEDAVAPDFTFPLGYSKAADLWFGDVNFSRAGDYQLQIKAVDGVGRTSIRDINPITVVEPGRIVSAKTGESLSGAKVSVFQFSPEVDDFILWPGDVFNQANPQFSGDDGSFRFIVPPGKYYFKVEKPGYRTFYTDIEEFAAHAAINFTIPLLSSTRLSLPFSIFGLREISLSIFPDFWGMSRIKGTPQVVSVPPAVVENMLGKIAPVFVLPNSASSTVDIRYLRGKKTILSTWATWAPLAQVQLPILDKLQKEDAQNVHVLLLSLQESQGVVESYLQRGGYGLQSVVDREGRLTKLYPVFTMPQHFFLDRKGILRSVFVGFMGDEELKIELGKL